MRKRSKFNYQYYSTESFQCQQKIEKQYNGTTCVPNSIEKLLKCYIHIFIIEKIKKLFRRWISGQKTYVLGQFGIYFCFSLYDKKGDKIYRRGPIRWMFVAG